MNGGLKKAIHYNPMENVVPKNIYNFEIINQKIKRNGISFSNAMDYTMEKVIPKSIYRISRNSGRGSYHFVGQILPKNWIYVPYFPQ